jgi:hypothetical protein
LGVFSPNSGASTERLTIIPSNSPLLTPTSYQIQNSGYQKHKTSFEIQNSSYQIQNSSFEKEKTSFEKHNSSYQIQNSSYQKDKSSFEKQKTGYAKHKTSFEKKKPSSLNLPFALSAPSRL